MSVAGAKTTRAAYFFVAPFLITFAVFLAYPLVQSLLLAFQQTSGPGFTTYVGFDNFAYLAKDPRFWKAVSNTALFTVISVAVQMPAALGLALLLNRGGVRGRAFWRLVLFSPSLVGLVFVALIFSLMFDENTGLVNVALHGITGGRFDLEYPWLEEHVMSAVIIAATWMLTGFNMVYFLAALQNVSQELAEAATVDGAGAWQRFVHVTLPAIRPVAGFVVLISLIASFQLFELPWILLNASPGTDDNGLTIVMYLYQQGFQQGDLGYASAVGWAMAVVLIGFAVVFRVLAARTED